MRRHAARSFIIRLTVAATAGPILASLAAAVPAAASPAPPAVPKQHPVPVYPVHGKPARIPAMTPWKAPATAWPSPGSAAVTLPSTGSGMASPAANAVPGPAAVRAGGLPVWAAAVPGAAAPGAVQVTMAGQSAAATAGIHGVVFAVTGSSGAAAGTRVHVSVNYSSFAYAYGGDYASRLHLVQLPACAMTTPQLPACQTQTPLDSADNVQAASVGANVTLPAGTGPQAPSLGTGAAGSPSASAFSSAGATGPSVVLAVTAAPSGSGGDFTATPLSEAGSWSAGDDAGAFLYSYPITVPPVPGGLQPQVSLDYNSQTVDGLTSSTNNQASWIGDGWDYSPGYIERTYKPCSQNTVSSQKIGDLCWSSDAHTTLSLDGQATTLVNGGSAGWHPENDNAERVSYQTTGPVTVNGTDDNGYWVITQTDGTKYYFGLNQLPGYASGDAATNSTWITPVYATTAGQPCYKTTFADSHCNMAWRWNLDYVVDPDSNAIAYFYNDKTNYYASGDLPTTTNPTANAAYQQGGALAKIEYGLRAGAIYGHTPAAQVNFDAKTDRTDVPTDLSCTNGKSCRVISPTFWTDYRLSAISTQTLKGSALAAVDSWSLSQSYPSVNDPTTPPSLWLGSITRTDSSGGPLLPAVTFSGTPMPNRVETAADINSGYSIITRQRLTSVTNETGGVTTVAYQSPGGACTSGAFPAPDDNTLSCYPDYWSPGGTSTLDWFNKYAVGTVTQQDTTGAGLPVVTSYSYSGAAWHYNDDALTRSSQRTWDQWRGFRTVTTQTGTSPDPVTKTTATYFQGMDGDYQSGGSTSSVKLTSSHADTVTDFAQYAGLKFENIVYNGTSGSQVTDTITLPWSSAATATETQPSPLPALKAFLTGTAETKKYTALAGGGDRESDASYSHDSYSRVTSASTVPDTANATEDTCTTTSYATNTSAWILDLATEVKVVSVSCGTTPALPADAVSDKVTLYDGATSVSADSPTTGNVTATQLATSYSGSTPVYTTESKASYDSYGRVLTSADADGRTTTTAYTPSSGAEPTQKTVTDPKGLVTATTYDPARDLPLTVTDPAGLTTAEQYDALGRLTAVWTPGNATTGPANDKFAYTPYSCTTTCVPAFTTSSTLAPDGSSYLQSQTLYDALGRVRETQQQTPDGGWNVTDTVYNSVGQQTLTSGPYFATGFTPGTLVAAPEAEVSAQDGKVYDGAGRVTQDTAYTQGKQAWATGISYGGDYTTTTYSCTSAVPTCGGTPQTTFTDGRGLTTAIYQYHAGVSADPADPASDYDKTGYAYTPAQKLATIGDAAGNTWSYTYDLAGNKVKETDPDAGTSNSSYDAAGQLMSVTDARSKTISYTYDADGRKTAEYDTTGGALESSASMIASWTYDTLAKGQLTSSSSYYGGQAYIEAVTSYNAFGEPNGTYTTIPSGQGKLAGNYVTQDTYTATGQLASYKDASLVGGLPTEIVNYTYNTAGQPTSANGIWAYVNSLTYTENGQPQEYTMGTGSLPAWVLDSYDQQTQRLTEQQTQVGVQTSTGVTPSVVDDTHYSYDNLGMVLSENNTPPAGSAQAQCFRYDYLGRLTQAWSQGSTCGSTSTPSASAESGAAAPYWNTYGYNAIGNLIARTSTAPSGQVTTTSSAYPGTGSAQPHAPTSAQVSGPPGNTTTQYHYTPSGGLDTVTSASQSQALSWDDADRLTSVTTTPAAGASSKTSYLYDASGALLIQQDPTRTTLFLPDEQIALDTSSSTGAVTGTRYYSIGGTTIATRTSSGTVDYLTGDRQGTATVAIDSSKPTSVTHRYYDPYGNPVGTPAPTWPGVKGFVGGTADTATGLTNLGAREYNPAAGQFISPDPLISPYNPQDLNAYGYASGNPSTLSDPTGKQVMCDSYCPPPTSSNSNNNNNNNNNYYAIVYQVISAYLPSLLIHPGGGGPAGPPPPPPVIRLIRNIAAQLAKSNVGGSPDCVGPVPDPSKCWTGTVFNKPSGSDNVPRWRKAAALIAILIHTGLNGGHNLPEPAEWGTPPQITIGQILKGQQKPRPGDPGTSASVSPPLLPGLGINDGPGSYIDLPGLGINDGPGSYIPTPGLGIVDGPGSYIPTPGLGILDGPGTYIPSPGIVINR